MSAGGVHEFICAECGTPIVVAIPKLPGEPLICAACIHAPGWFSDPIMRKALDPTGLANPPPHELTQ